MFDKFPLCVFSCFCNSCGRSHVRQRGELEFEDSFQKVLDNKKIVSDKNEVKQNHLCLKTHEAASSHWALVPPCGVAQILLKTCVDSAQALHICSDLSWSWGIRDVVKHLQGLTTLGLSLDGWVFWLTIVAWLISTVLQSPVSMNFLWTHQKYIPGVLPIDHDIEDNSKNLTSVPRFHAVLVCRVCYCRYGCCGFCVSAQFIIYTHRGIFLATLPFSVKWNV